MGCTCKNEMARPFLGVSRHVNIYTISVAKVKMVCVVVMHDTSVCKNEKSGDDLQHQRWW